MTGTRDTLSITFDMRYLYLREDLLNLDRPSTKSAGIDETGITRLASSD